MLNKKITKNLNSHKLVKTGTIDGWTYRLYADKWIEMYSTKSFPANSGAETVSLPFTMADQVYDVNIVPAYNGTIVTKFSLTGSNNKDGRGYSSFVFYKTLSSRYTTTFAFAVKGYIA